MHALNALPAAVLAPADVDVLLLVLVVLVPQAARAIAATEARATSFIDDLKALLPLLHHIREMHQTAHFW
jgi:hypothetical protein